MVSVAPGALPATRRRLEGRRDGRDSSMRRNGRRPTLAAAYPAHLHIDLMPSVPRAGARPAAHRAAARGAARAGVAGVHLGVDAANRTPSASTSTWASGGRPGAGRPAHGPAARLMAGWYVAPVARHQRGGQEPHPDGRPARCVHRGRCHRGRDIHPERERPVPRAMSIRTHGCRRLEAVLSKRFGYRGRVTLRSRRRAPSHRGWRASRVRRRSRDLPLGRAVHARPVDGRRRSRPRSACAMAWIP